jgi:hypothetical protein
MEAFIFVFLINTTLWYNLLPYITDYVNNKYHKVIFIRYCMETSICHSLLELFKKRYYALHDT